MIKCISARGNSSFRSIYQLCCWVKPLLLHLRVARYATHLKCLSSTVPDKSSGFVLLFPRARGLFDKPCAECQRQPQQDRLDYKCCSYYEVENSSPHRKFAKPAGECMSCEYSRRVTNQVKVKSNGWETQRILLSPLCKTAIQELFYLYVVRESHRGWQVHGLWQTKQKGIVHNKLHLFALFPLFLHNNTKARENSSGWMLPGPLQEKYNRSYIYIYIYRMFCNCGIRR